MESTFFLQFGQITKNHWKKVFAGGVFNLV